MDWYLIVLRILHIGSAVFWAGSSILFTLFIEPTVNAIGPAGQQFMQHLGGIRKMPRYISGAAGLTVVAGILLYWKDSAGFDLDWVTSPIGLGFTIGGAAALIAFLLGASMVGPGVTRMGALGKEIEASGGPPTEAQMGEIGRIQHRLHLIGRIDLVLIGIAILAMATARYW